MAGLKLRIKIEKAIFQATVRDLLAAGYFLAIDNGEEKYPITNSYEEIMAHYCETDEERLFVYTSKDVSIDNYFGWIFFVYGNSGWDVICDYTVNLEGKFPTAEKLADKYEDLLA